MDKENLETLLHVLWDARDFIEEYGLEEEIEEDLIKRIEAQMDIVENNLWNRIDG